MVDLVGRGIYLMKDNIFSKQEGMSEMMKQLFKN